MDALIQESVRGVARWLDAASTATGLPGHCYRTAVFHRDRSISWMFPRSNTSELIHAWLDLAALTQDSRYDGLAQAYALRMIEDSERGLYRGPHHEAHGLLWYWRDDGSYTGGYSMRVPGAFRRLLEKGGDERFFDACRTIGRTFLDRQLPSGVANVVAWSPQKGWFYEDTMGSRYAYCLATFATLFALTQDPSYEAAYERAVQALLTMQQPDGSFYQFYHPVTLQPKDRSVKVHFFAYIFNALEEAYSIFRDDRLIACGEALCNYLAGLYYYRRQLPYCLDAEEDSDIVEADSAVQDCASGLLWLYEVSGDLIARDLGVRLWREARECQIMLPNHPGCDGAIVRGMNPALSEERSENIPVAHLQFDPSRLARCEVWFAANHVFASKKLLDLARNQPRLISNNER